MENATYTFNISTDATTESDVTVPTITVTKERAMTSVRHTEATSAEQATTTRWLSTSLNYFNITGDFNMTSFTNQTSITTQENFDNYDGDYNGYHDYGDIYMYTGYTFERPFYLYIWEFLVIFTFLFNIVVISVLLRRNMRNPTNVVLAAIAISDSLTGLVTLPSYIMVYQKYTSSDAEYNTDKNYDGYYSYSNNPDLNSTGILSEYSSDGNYLLSNANTQYSQEQEAVDGCEITKSLCIGFMVSKYFLSKSFHSMSIFLTLFLGIHRYISIRFPYRSQLLLTLPRTFFCCVAVVIFSPILHIYHLFGERAVQGLCQWELKEEGCGGGCIYLWMAFFIRHLIPCVALLVFTTLFILQLHTGERNLRRMDSSKSQISRRKDENRRISVIVVAVVIVFLIPEIPYGIFLLYNAIDKATNQGKGIDLEANRVIHLVYELLLVLSFHANFYIYTFFNRRFRKTLYRTYLKPVRRLLGDTDRLSVSRDSSTSHRPSKRKTETVSVTTKVEMESMLKPTLSNQPLIQSNSATLDLVEKDSKL